MSICDPALVAKYSFPTAKFGASETPWNLLPLLYFGAAKYNVREVIREIEQGKFGEIRPERIELVDIIHETLNSDLVSGRSQLSLKGIIQLLRNFVSWCDESNASLSIESLEDYFLQWTKALQNKHIFGNLSKRTISGYVSTLCAVFDKILDYKTGLRYKTTVRLPRKERVPEGFSHLEKQDLEEVFRFGTFLCDITNGLPETAIWGDLPVVIPLRAGGQLTEWSKLRPAEMVKRLNDPNQPIYRKRETEATRAKYIADHSFRTRHAIINLRLEAELLIFTAQTGLNLAQAFTLERTKYKFISVIDGYEMQGYKDRSQSTSFGTVHSEYRNHFTTYIKWRDNIFSDSPSKFLFPFINVYGRADYQAPAFSSIRKRCKILNMQLFGPRELRKSRSNFFLRQSQNPELTAKVSQHTVETFYRNYHKPSHQIALVEIARFHATHDPALAAVGPGNCVSGEPSTMEVASPFTPEADCLAPSGCLFCDNHRDIDSEDHIWSLLTFRELKVIELSKAGTLTNQYSNPAHIAIERINGKLKFIQSISSHASDWYAAATEKVSQGNYHPKWRGFIRLQEITSQ
ncbi:site-specific integrase [Pseudomonas capsici]|uniref:site-specific integrase n=1 Tax=Pseudomonas capsici TaxID=2810614 RepID=UPI0021F22594|nr:site-specific integrase [Pseudomonas capsici]MCV4289898.1 site-specific integrase [Pseudomonas capsici]